MLSRVVWVTHYQLYLDIMKSFDKSHYTAFTKNGADYATTAIDKANQARRDLAAKSKIEVFDVVNMQTALNTFFKTSIGEQTFENANLFSLEYKRDSLSPDGVHHVKYLYTAVAKQLMIGLIACNNETYPVCREAKKSEGEDEWNEGATLAPISSDVVQGIEEEDFGDNETDVDADPGNSLLI